MTLPKKRRAGEVCLNDARNGIRDWENDQKEDRWPKFPRAGVATNRPPRKSRLNIPILPLIFN
jgi:hypothetical protein